MAMFSRRSLQKILDHLAAHLPFSARAKLVHELNQPSTSALGFEWETALLFAFSHIGKVEYEAASNGGSKPDITFVEEAKEPICFAADIATVSDHGLEVENPTERLSKALIRLWKKYDLPGSTYFDIKGEATGPHYKDRKMRLKLPSGHELEKMLEKYVAPAFKRARDEKLSTITVPINEPGVNITINYDANRRYGGGRYPSFADAYSLTRNPVYAKLKSKTKQLKKSGLISPFGIFLCDGECTLLKRTQRLGDAVGIDQVVGEFFRQNTSVSFVGILTFPPVQTAAFVGIVKELRITLRLCMNPRAKKQLDATALREVINRALSRLPAPIATPHDALDWIENEPATQGMPIHELTRGGGLMSASLTVSARKIQEVLAGRMTPQQFFDNYNYPNSPLENPFLKALKQGFTIESVTLTKTPALDDDLLEFRFAPDPAIQKFEATKK